MYLLFSGALVMWMAAGFTMLEAGLVRSKNVSEIVTKNIGLYSIACVMYLVLERTKPASSMVKPAAIHITRAPENKRYMVFKANSISLIAFL